MAFFLLLLCPCLCALYRVSDVYRKQLFASFNIMIVGDFHYYPVRLSLL